MRRISLGAFSLMFVGTVLLMFGLHYGNVVAMLNGMVAPFVSFLGMLLGVMGYFERDKKRVPALIGMILNAGLLVIWIVLLIS
jgi:hypothetical protein